MISHSRLVASRLKRRSLNRSIRRISLSPGKKNNIVVVVRVRPENEKEQGSSVKVLQVLDRNVLIFDPIEDEEDKFFFQGVRQNSRDLLKKPHKNLAFNFDYVFDGKSTNEDIFYSTTSTIIDRVLNGFNSSVFAYGATGAGKTFTMIGTPENPGIIFLMVMALFQQIEQLQDKVCDVSISYLEVYNETIKDLLTPSPPLSIREDSRGTVVSGLSHFKPNNAEHLMQLLHFGNKNRTQHPTDANSESSRSHAVFQVYVRQKDKVSGLSSNVRIAKMSLIDLAGSERATVVSTREKARLREGANINQSLLALGSCINALADRKGKTHHVPYRNSKLTRILKDSLGGNCFTVMIAAVSPSSVSYEDTYNTLKYADRAKGIKLTLKHNVVNVDAHISKYVKIVEAHQNEILELKAKLQKYESLYASASIGAKVEKCSSGTMTSPVTVNAFVAESRTHHSSDASSLLHEEFRKLREKYIDCESTLRLLKAKKNWKQDIQRLHNILSGEYRVATCTNMDTVTKTMDLKEKRLLNEKSKLVELLVDNKNKFEQMKHQMDAAAAAKLDYQELISKSIEATMEMKHVLAVANLKAKYEDTYKTVLESLATIVRRQQYILEGRGVLSADLISDLESIISQLHGVKEVNWADQATPKHNLHPEVLELYRLLPATPLLNMCNIQQPGSITKAINHVASCERHVSPDDRWRGDYNMPANDLVRRSLDATFAVMDVNSPVPVCSTTVFNQTFSPVVFHPAISTPEKPAYSFLNKTFTPVYEHPSNNGKKYTYAEVLKPRTSPDRPVLPDNKLVCPPSEILSLASSPIVANVETEAKMLKIPTQEVARPQLSSFRFLTNSTAPEKTNIFNKLSVSPVSQHKAKNPFKILQVANTDDKAGETRKMPKPSWARPFSFKLKAKENCYQGPKQTMYRQTSFLPRPGTSQNKHKPLLLHRAISTPVLNKVNVEHM